MPSPPLPQAATALNGHAVADKPLSVQFLAAAQEAMAANPLMALKLQQIQQMQQTMKSGAALAAQVGGDGGATACWREGPRRAVGVWREARLSGLRTFA